MEEKELVSVIIPVYNVENYLQECVDSVLTQTYEHFEIILVDDGSTDTSGQLCDTYSEADSRVNVLHQENRGLSEARNAGLSMAKGTYAYFLDSDDWILPNTLEVLINKAEIETSDVVFFDARSFEDGQPEKQIQQNYIRTGSYKTESGQAVLKQLQENKEYHSAVPLLFIKKSLLDDIGLRFEPGILYEDMIFTYALLCQAKRVAYINQPFYQRRYRSNSIMTSKKTAKNYLSAEKVYYAVRQTSANLGIMQNDMAKDYIARCAFNSLNYYVSLKPKDKLEFRTAYKKMKKHILRNQSYGNKALQMRCYGRVPWAIYKVYEKAVSGMKGKQK